MKTKLIGITGKARAGKDTLATYFLERGWQRIAFADHLKKVTALIAQEPEALYFDEVTKEERSPSLRMPRRRALQNVGKGMRDALGENIWVNIALNKWKLSGHVPAVTTDVRYDNEAQIIKDQGGIIIQVLRPDNVGLTGEAAQHESERGVATNLLDFVVVNDGDINELLGRAEYIHNAVWGNKK